MIRRLLFETALGDKLLALLEHWAGLAVVDARALRESPDRWEVRE